MTKFIALAIPFLMFSLTAIPTISRADNLSHLQKTLSQLEDARTELQKVTPDKAGRRNKAMVYINRAILQVEGAIRYENNKKNR